VWEDTSLLYTLPLVRACLCPFSFPFAPRLASSALRRGGFFERFLRGKLTGGHRLLRSGRNAPPSLGVARRREGTKETYNSQL
jgi:hypothetical protein